jgi:hypothetical protein
MGERYWITGVQFAMLKSLGSLEATDFDLELFKEIEENQFIGNFPTEEDKQRFKKHMLTAVR